MNTRAYVHLCGSAANAVCCRRKTCAATAGEEGEGGWGCVRRMASRCMAATSTTHELLKFSTKRVPTTMGNSHTEPKEKGYRCDKIRFAIFFQSYPSILIGHESAGDCKRIRLRSVFFETGEARARGVVKQLLDSA